MIQRTTRRRDRRSGSVLVRGAFGVLANAALAVSALGALAAVGLAGCGDGERASSSHGDQAPAARRVLAVAAAADLQFALDEVVAELVREQPSLDARVTYGSSGTFFAQLSQGAPFDIYFSADLDYPIRLVRAGVAAEADLFEYATGHLVLWAPAGSPIDPARGADALRDPALRRLAIANPDHAPYGRAAREALTSLGVWQALGDRLVLGENIAQAAQYAQSGAADAGVIALSLALAPPMQGRGTWWEIPQDRFTPLRQGGVILGHATNRADAERLRAHVLAPGGARVLERYGFVLPRLPGKAAAPQ